MIRRNLKSGTVFRYVINGVPETKIWQVRMPGRRDLPQPPAHIPKAGSISWANKSEKEVVVLWVPGEPAEQEENEWGEICP